MKRTRTLTPLTRCLAVVLCVAILFACNEDPESKPEENLPQEINSIFKKWDTSASPGAAVAVIKNGKIIFQQGYGMANLEYGVPIEPTTVFHIASESKQFTAYCIALLEQQGKLSFDDDIRIHLPYVPDFGEKITIKNLLHHTSGLRDQWQLLAIAGTREDDIITGDDIIKIVEKQQSLNFPPGERHLYCNTGYNLLAEIVREVSGKSLRRFAQQEIFEPLGMENTHFHDNYKEIVKNRAFSYRPADSTSFENSILNFSTVGASNLMTTVQDEAKWLSNLNTGKIGGMDLVYQLYELGVLNSGDTLEYAFGLTLDHYKGYQRIGHGGTDAGFNSYVVRFPEEQLGIIVFSNLSEITAYDEAMEIADLFLIPIPEKQQNKTFDLSLIKGKAGRYFSDEGLLCEIVDSTELYLKYPWGFELLTPLSDTAFSFFHGSGQLTLSKTDDQFLEYDIYDEKQILKDYEPINEASLNKEEYEGIYRNDELEAQYVIDFNGRDLLLKHRKYEDATLTPITANQFSSPHWWMSNLIFVRNEDGEINGFEVNEGRVLHLYFEKVEE